MDAFNHPPGSATIRATEHLSKGVKALKFMTGTDKPAPQESSASRGKAAGKRERGGGVKRKHEDRVNEETDAKPVIKVPLLQGGAQWSVTPVDHSSGKPQVVLSENFSFSKLTVLPRRSFGGMNPKVEAMLPDITKKVMKFRAEVEKGGK